MADFKIKPLDGRVVIERLEATETKTASGLIIPEASKEKPTKGKIVAVSDGIKGADGKKTPLEVKVGDMVLFAKWGGTEIKMENDDKEYVILKESDILAILAN